MSLRTRTRLTLAVLALATALTLQARAQDYYQPQPNDQDPPDRVGRLSIVNGPVSLQTSAASDFAPAEPNYPITTGDRLYTGDNARTEVQSGQLAIRLASQTDLTVTTLSNQYAQLGLAQGSVRLRAFRMDPDSTVEIDTPNGAITLTQPADVRIDTYSNNVTVVTVDAGSVQATGPNLSQFLSAGQSLQLTGSNPIYAEAIEPQQQDDLDTFSYDRDRLILSSRSVRQRYVSPDLVGAEDLDAYGEWQPSPEYGTVWYPRNVSSDWQPYRNGHWAYVQPWGYTWVESEPWGFAPFHYGRWAQFNGRWGWVPGPSVVRPVYSPALVAFVGGSNFSISLNFGGNDRYRRDRDHGVAAWFPLGPREPYNPWYRASNGYVNRVNVSNIYDRDERHIRDTYNNRSTNIYVNNTTYNHITYINKNVGTIAVPQQTFNSGRHVDRDAVRVDQRQLQQAQIIQNQAPAPPPQRSQMQHAPPQAVPQRIDRPILQTPRGQAPAVPGAVAQPVPLRPLPPDQQRHPDFNNNNRDQRNAPQAQPARPGAQRIDRNGQPTQYNAPDAQPTRPGMQRIGPDGRPTQQQPVPQQPAQQQQSAPQPTRPGMQRIGPDGRPTQQQPVPQPLPQQQPGQQPAQQQPQRQPNQQQPQDTQQQQDQQRRQHNNVYNPHTVNEVPATQQPAQPTQPAAIQPPQRTAPPQQQRPGYAPPTPETQPQPQRPGYQQQQDQQRQQQIEQQRQQDLQKQQEQQRQQQLQQQQQNQQKLQDQQRQQQQQQDQQRQQQLQQQRQLDQQKQQEQQRVQQQQEQQRQQQVQQEQIRQQRLQDSQKQQEQQRQQQLQQEQVRQQQIQQQRQQDAQKQQEQQRQQQLQQEQVRQQQIQQQRQQDQQRQQQQQEQQRVQQQQEQQRQQQIQQEQQRRQQQQQQAAPPPQRQQPPQRTAPPPPPDNKDDKKKNDKKEQQPAPQ